MKHKILIIILLILFSVNLSSVFAQVGPENPNDPYTFDDFKADFTTHPVLAAETYPSFYVQILKENPKASATTPQHVEAYEKLIEEDVKYLNANKEAFMAYVDSQGFHFTSIGGEFKSFDKNTGKFETKGADGEMVASFTLNALKILEKQGKYNFLTNDNGELVYDIDAYGDNDETIRVSGNVEEKNGEIILHNGKISVGEKFNIELTGGNKARLVEGHHYLKDFKSGKKGFVEVEVVDSPIILPKGILMNGKALLVTENVIDLLPNSKYQNDAETIFEVSKQTRLITDDISACDHVFHSCILLRKFESKNRDKWYYKPKEDGNLIVYAIDGNQIKINAKDGYYNNIIVKQIPESKVLIGTVGYKKYYLLANRGLVDQFGGEIYNVKLLDKIKKHPNFQIALQETKTNRAKVDLTLMRADNSKTEIVFSNFAPISKGNLKGFQTNIGNVFEDVSSQNYPWIIYNGKPSANTKGRLKETLPDKITKLVTQKQGAKLSLLFESFESLNKGETESILKESKNIDLNTLRQIINKYEPEIIKGIEEYAKEDLKRILILQKSNIDSPAASELQTKLINDFNSIQNEYMAFLIKATEGREELQKELLNNVNNIVDPGSVLASIDSYNLKKRVIEKTIFIEEEFLSLDYLENYLKELEKLDPKLQQLAIENLDLNKGLFRKVDKEGEAYRRVLEFHKNKPKQMEAFLRKMPTLLHIGFDPEKFRTIYFEKHFEEQTKDLDFANKYSVALTAARYLEQKGDMNQEDRIKVIDLIIQQRERFANHVILDENTYYIPVTHEEGHFENGKMVQLARDSGVKEIADPNLKGNKDIEKTKQVKEKFLGFVKGSKEKGKTTIHFNNHGGPEHQWLSSGQVGSETSNNMDKPGAISYIEFGNALLERGDLNDVTIIIDSCYSNDFKDKLYAYLYKKNTAKMPIIITETNRGQVGYGSSTGSVFGNALKETIQKGKPLTGANIYKVESKTFFEQDLSVTMPIANEEEAEFTDPETPGVTTMGSTFDDGAAESPTKPPEEEEKLEGLPPTVIEISDSEEEMMDTLEADESAMT